MNQRIVLAATIMMAMTVSAMAQNPQGNPNTRNLQGAQPGAPGTQPVQGAGAQAGQEVDHAIAACLLLGNQEEVALAEFAQGRAKDQRVKQFAEMMQRDHAQAIEKLRRIAPQLASLNLEVRGGNQAGAANAQPGGAPPRGANARPGAQPGAQATQLAQPGAAGTVGQAGSDVHSQMLALERTVAETCLALTQRELGEHNGPEFDMAYIGQQCGAHLQMLAKLQGSEQFASGELRGFIAEARQTVEHHFQQAKQIKQALKQEEGQGSQAAQRTGAAPARR